MKIRLSELKPNPFKKEINKGRMNKEIVEKIKSNIKELGLMGSLPVFQKDEKYFLVAGHHRVQALKETFGNNFEVEVTLHNYSKENLLRGMVVENLTQRVDELMEVGDNLNAIRNWLKANSTVETVRDKFHKGEYFQVGTKEIYDWLNKNGEVMSIGKISQYLKIYDNLDRKLLEKAKSNLDRAEKDVVNVREAIALSRLEKKEQAPMKKLLDKADVSSDTKLKLVTAYKNASPEIQEKVKKGDLNIKEILIENLEQKIKKKIEEQKEKDKGKFIVTHYKQYQREAGNRVGETNDKILQTCVFLNGLEKSGVLYELDLKTMLKVIESGTIQGKNYFKFMDRILTNVK